MGTDFKPTPRKETARQSIGFEERLKRELRTGTKAAKKQVESKPVQPEDNASKELFNQAETSEIVLPTACATSAGLHVQSESEAPKTVNTSELAPTSAAKTDEEYTRPEYEVEDLGSEFVVRASLPGVHSAAEAEIEVSENELRIRGLSEVAGTASDVIVPLPRVVNADSARAKWLK